MGADVNDAVLARLEQLEAEVRALRARTGRVTTPAVVSGDSPVTRRRLLGLAGAATAGAVGATVLASSPADATQGAMQFGAANDAGTDITSLAASGTDKTLDVTNSTSGDAIHGTAGAGGGDGVVGTSPGSNGVAGSSTSGSGVSANSGSGAGLVAVSTSGVAILSAIGLAVSGAHLELQPHSSVSGPPSGSHNAGQFWMDTNAVLFQCVSGGATPVWVKQAPLVTLPTPVRVYDSRAGQPNQSPNVQGTLTFTSAPPSAANRVIKCAKDASSGTTVVPAGARTLLMNLTVIAQSGVGALNVYGNGTTQPSTSNINWSAGGQLAANSVTSACDGAQAVQVAIVASAGASTHFILDVFGYYL